MFIVLMDCLFPGRTGYGPMDRISLEHYTFFRRLGVFGIDPKSRQGADDFLRHGLRILEDHRSVLFVTAEGRFNDVRRRPIELRPGVAHLLKRVPNAVVVPLALEYPFWSERRPEALAHFGLPVVVEAGAGVSTWNKALQVALTQSVDTLAALSMKQDAALFQPLIKGRVGVGGVYDIWRRSASLIRGVHFDPSHEAIMKRSEERRI